MNGVPKQAFVIAAYSTDPWETSLPVLRYLGACEMTGCRVIYGNRWSNIDPEQVSAADIVLIQRDFPRFVKECAQVFQNAWQQNKPVIYEIDDWLFGLPEDHISRPSLTEFLYPILWTISQADAVVTSTAVLRDHLKPANPDIFVLPNYLNDRLWAFQEPRRESMEPGKITLGYIGGKTHTPDLSSIQPALLNLLKRYDGKLILKIWGARPADELLGHPAVDWTALDILDYAAFAKFTAAQQIDILIAPLVDNAFNQAKSAIKFLEYSVLGAPGVYSRVSPYESIVDHDKNGFLAATQEEWEQCIGFLIENPHSRYELGLAAQQTVKKDWLLSQHAGEWVEVYNQACLTRRARKNGQQPQSLSLTVQTAQKVQDHMSDLHRSIRQAEDLNQNLKSKLDTILVEATSLRDELEAVKQNRTWRLMQRISRARTSLFPPGSRAEKLLKTIRILH